MSAKFRSVASPRPRYRRALIALLAALFLALLWRQRGPALRALGISPAPPPTLTVFVTADTRGHLEPCGCRADQSGGLPVRGTLLARDHSPCRLLVDVGNLLYGVREYDLLKADYILRGMTVMGYDMVNLGRNETLLSKAQLLSLVRAHPKLTFISCNVVDAKTGRPVVRPFAVKTFGDFRVGVVGVTSAEEGSVGQGLAVTPPLEALTRWVPRAARACDMLWAAAFVDRQTMDRIARRFFEVDGVLGGDVTQSWNQAETVNDAVLFAVTDLGKVLGRLDFRRTGRRRLGLIASGGIKTKDTLPRDARIMKVVDAFKRELKRRRLAFAESRDHLDPVTPVQRSTTNRYVGAWACRRCHPQAVARWRASEHSHSLDALKPRHNEYDPECLPCHTLGYGAPDGYVSETDTPGLARVQCESCHGRAGDHVRAYRQRRPPAVSTLRVVTPNLCVQCHDEENSADFDYDTFWPKIAHPSKKAHTK